MIDVEANFVLSHWHILAHEPVIQRLGDCAMRGCFTLVLSRILAINLRNATFPEQLYE